GAGSRRARGSIRGRLAIATASRSIPDPCLRRRHVVACHPCKNSTGSRKGEGYLTLCSVGLSRPGRGAKSDDSIVGSGRGAFRAWLVGVGSRPKPDLGQEPTRNHEANEVVPLIDDQADREAAELRTGQRYDEHRNLNCGDGLAQPSLDRLALSSHIHDDVVSSVRVYANPRQTPRPDVGEAYEAARVMGCAGTSSWNDAPLVTGKRQAVADTSGRLTAGRPRRG